MKTLFNCETEEEASELIAKGADVNERNGTKRTPLFFAAYSGRLNVMLTLLDAGADVNAKDQWGETPLLGATMNGHTNAVRLLLLAGADVNAKDRLVYSFISNGNTNECAVDGVEDSNGPVVLRAMSIYDPWFDYRAEELGVPVETYRAAFLAGAYERMLENEQLSVGWEDPMFSFVQSACAGGI